MIKSLVQSNSWMEQVIFSVILDKKEIKGKSNEKENNFPVTPKQKGFLRILW